MQDNKLIQDKGMCAGNLLNFSEVINIYLSYSKGGQCYVMVNYNALFQIWWADNM